MAILVSGSAGHLGEGIVRSLRSECRAAIGVDLKPSPFTERVGTICDPRFVTACMRHARAVIHAATLHKPHLVTHRLNDFIDTNVKGTLNLLEAAVAANVECFVYVSTTSTFGAASQAARGESALWVTENLPPAPRNIYGASKLMAESLCELVSRKHRLPTLILRTSRFFPEPDDDSAVRSRYDTANVQANELLYRRVDLADAVAAALLAVERAREIGFARYIISATSPFTPADLASLRSNAPQVVRRIFPACEALYAERSWKLFPQIDRVYVNDRARADLGWIPRHDFAQVLECLSAARDFRSALAREVGSKGYHDTTFAEGPYPVETAGE